MQEPPTQPHLLQCCIMLQGMRPWRLLVLRPVAATPLLLVCQHQVFICCQAVHQRLSPVNALQPCCCTTGSSSSLRALWCSPMRCCCSCRCLARACSCSLCLLLLLLLLMLPLLLVLERSRAVGCQGQMVLHAGAVPSRNQQHHPCCKRLLSSPQVLHHRINRIPAAALAARQYPLHNSPWKQCMLQQHQNVPTNLPNGNTPPSVLTCRKVWLDHMMTSWTCWGSTCTSRACFAPAWTGTEQGGGTHRRGRERREQRTAVHTAGDEGGQAGSRCQAAHSTNCLCRQGRPHPHNCCQYRDVLLSGTLRCVGCCMQTRLSAAACKTPQAPTCTTCQVSRHAADHSSSRTAGGQHSIKNSPSAAAGLTPRG